MVVRQQAGDWILKLINKRQRLDCNLFITCFQNGRLKFLTFLI
ncbi:hypothetical protein HanPSC8_Chr13g0570791 [Helianthus annuus]|nr:hypothetical protein HanPSC8_Chr13g0570791 [Helianthus annuus]